MAREARRRKRKLEQTGDIEIQTDAAFDETLISWILDKSAQRHGANSLTSEKQRSSVLALFNQYRSSLHLAFIKKDGAYLAAHLGFKYQQTLYYYVPVTTDEQRSLSPGIILLHEIIQQLPTMQLDTIDFLRGEESYKQDWGNTHLTNSAMLLKGQFGSNLKDRLFTELWLKRNSG
ncbi:GNAT family N-acetyltransferase [Salinimonas marina]|uniref:GNAT family N-acetyltransferase n=1 Tax=Salinimonas marina TaxID=2785918 RepID=A0A7S9DYN1_9ALTE|nr:GNAT family N-acetyltransferase [Salinimonas marina]QPG06384.1 GNAT family N-acetyltransferase [Salinimonas marina]